jgi:hypothetical protein
MATQALVGADRPTIVGLASTFTIYPSYPQAVAAAITLSAANSSAAVYVGDVTEGVTAPGRVDLVAGGPGNWIIQLASTTAYTPRANAIAQAFTVSAANANAQVYVARTFLTCTGP